jgi:hypothetical protein
MLSLAASLLVGVQGLVVAVLVRVVQCSFLGVLFGVSGEAVSGVAVVGGLFMVALLEMLHSGAVVLHRVLEVVGSLLVGFNYFLVLFGMVLLRRHGAKDWGGKEVWRGIRLAKNKGELGTRFLTG